MLVISLLRLLVVVLLVAPLLGFPHSRSTHPWFAFIAVISVIGAIRWRKRSRPSSLA